MALKRVADTIDLAAFVAPSLTTWFALDPDTAQDFLLAV